METAFLRFMNMSITASFLIIAVILLRLIFKNMPKWIRCLMWAMVGIRLAVPFSIESVFSVIPNAQKYDCASITSTSYVASNVGTHSTGVVNESAKSQFNLIAVISILWLVGIAVMFVYMVASYIRLHFIVRESVRVKENIWMCDRISSPFVLGVFKPKIYILLEMNQKEVDYVVAHEKAHLKRHDNIWKPLGFLLLCAYWFNPLCWIAYYLFNKDIELACDEKVIKELGIKSKKDYSNALLSCSVESKLISACPLAFGENNVKHRIKNVLSYKRPKVYVVVSAFAICAAIAVMFMTNPLSASAKNHSTKIPDKSVSDKVDDTDKIEQQSEIVTEPILSTEPTTVEETTVKVTEPISTEPATEVEEVVEEVISDEYYEENYSNDSYIEDDFDNSYTEDAYSETVEDSNNSGLVEIQPFEESESYKNTLEKYHHIYDGYSSGGLALEAGDPSPAPYEKIEEDVLKWDVNP